MKERTVMMYYSLIVDMGYVESSTTMLSMQKYLLVMIPDRGMVGQKTLSSSKSSPVVKSNIMNKIELAIEVQWESTKE